MTATYVVAIAETTATYKWGMIVAIALILAVLVVWDWLERRRK